MALANGVVGLIDAAMCALLAAMVFAVGLDRRANRSLAFLLIVEGAAQLFAAIANLAEPRTAIAAAGTMPFLIALLPCLYLLVLRELETPFGRALRLRGATFALTLATSAFAGWVVLSGRPGDDLSNSTVGAAVELVFLATLLLGLVVGAWALILAAPGTPRRRQAAWFVIAFTVRDVPFALYFLGDRISAAGGVPPFPVTVLGIALPFVGTLLFVPILAYAILSQQLFDIDLRIKRGLRRGIVATAFLLVFFLAAETAERLFTTRFGPVIGLLAAGGLTLALRPLERWSSRVADTAMPSVNGSEEYLSQRRMEVYRAAFESAREGGITDRERATLARLRARLALAPEEAARIEQEAA